MSDTARDYQTNDQASIEGFEELLEIVPTDADNLTITTEALTTDADSGEWMTAAEAASALKKSERTIQRYAKAGKLRSKTDMNGRLLICLPTPADDLATHADSQIELAPTADSCVTNVATMPKPEFDSHLAMIRELQMKLESLTFRNGYLESKLEERETQIKLLTDSQHKSSWWAGFRKWFLGQ